MADTPIGKLTINALEAFVLLTPVVVLWVFVASWVALILVWIYAFVAVWRALPSGAGTGQARVAQLEAALLECARLGGDDMETDTGESCDARAVRSVAQLRAGYEVAWRTPPSERPSGGLRGMPMYGQES